MSLVHIAFGCNMYPRWTPVGGRSLKPNLPKVSRDSVLDSVLNSLSLNRKYFYRSNTQENEASLGFLVKCTCTKCILQFYIDMTIQHFMPHHYTVFK